MGYWRNSGALIALSLLLQMSPAQEAMPHEMARPEPKIYKPEGREGQTGVRPEDFGIGHVDGDPYSRLPPEMARQRRLQDAQKAAQRNLDSMHDYAGKHDWASLWYVSQHAPALTPSRDVLSFALEAAQHLVNQANSAYARGDWKQVRSLLEPLGRSGWTAPQTSRVTLAGESTLSHSPDVAYLLKPKGGLSQYMKDPTLASREQPTLGAAGIFPGNEPKSTASASASNQPPIELYPEAELKLTLDSGKTLYARATLRVAEQMLSSGDPAGAVPLFREVYTSDSSEATPETSALFKKAYLDAASAHYDSHDWQASLKTCNEIQEQQFFSLSLTERQRVSLIAKRSENLSEAASLPAGTLAVDHLKVGLLGSYFHVFAANGVIDLAVRANSVQELLANPDFQGIHDRIARGSDLLLTPSVSSVGGWPDALHASFPDTTVWSDPYIGEAAQSLSSMQQAKLTPTDFDVAILLPKNATQQAAMGLGWTDAQRDHAWQASEYLKTRAPKNTIVTQAANRTGITGWATDLIGTDSKKEVLHSLANSKGVVVLFAHGDRDGVYTPEGQKLTVADVSGLDLHANHPIVLLMSCEGGQGSSDASSSLAQAIKKAGATAVWSYGEKVDAAEASSATVKFLEKIREGKTPLESFRSLSRDKAIKAGPRLHLKVELQTGSTHG